MSHPRSGGAEVYTDLLLRALADEGHDITLFTSRVNAETPSCDSPYEVHRTGGRLTVYPHVRRAIEGGRFGKWDLVIDQVNTIPFLIRQGPSVASRGGLIFQTCEDIWPHIMPFPVSTVGRRVLEPRWMRHFESTPTVTLAESSAQDLRRFGLKHVSVVPVGAIPSRPSRRGEKFERPSCVHVGRLVSYKRVDLILEAVRHMPARFEGFQLHVVGDGPEYRRLKRIAPTFVEFHGHLSDQDKTNVVSRSHLNLVASVREGWGLVVTEAAALGTPTLAYDVSGLRDSVRLSGGWLCPPDPQAMGHWIPPLLSKILEDPRTGLNPSYEPPSWAEVARRAIAIWVP